MRRMMAGIAAASAFVFASPATAQESWPWREAYVAAPEIVPAARGRPARFAQGVVFEDLDKDGTRDRGEPGVDGALVSNGLEVVRTKADGAYRLPARDDMAVFVIQPTGWRVPTNADWVPQFSYQHKPAGSPKRLRFGGLAPTGPLPAAINFPLIRIGDESRFSCAVLGDTQAYSNAEVGFVRDSVVDDVLDRGPGHVDCVIAVGDVMGDDLGLIPRMADVLGALGVPQWWVHGNHDYDFDADHDRDSADSWRRLWGPNYYAFEQGGVLFIALDNVVYPCGPEDARLPGRDECVSAAGKRYNGRITDTQMSFVRNLLALTDPKKPVVVATHVPLVSFVDQSATIHQTDNVLDLYKLLDGREALSISGHTHAVENLAPGDRFAGWRAAVGVEALPFRHIIAGAVSGGWWAGDFDTFGVPMALGRMGDPRGWVQLDFQDGVYVENFFGAQLGPERVMWTSLNTPAFRAWFEALTAWQRTPAASRDPVPPVSIHDLPDVKIVTPKDLAEGTWLTANVWMGSSESVVSVSINGGPMQPMERTQRAQGEEARVGAEFADPFSAQRQLSVARVAMQSRSGDARAQGVEIFQGRTTGPAPPQPHGSLADRSNKLWRFRLPEGLAEGAHIAAVRVTDRHQRIFEDRIVFEVRKEHPPARFRTDVWSAFENGPPVR